MATYDSIDEANAAVAQKIIDAQPRLVDVVPAKTVIPALEGRVVLHAGPPIAFEDMPDPVQGAAIGAALFEGWASDEASARQVCSEEVQFAPNNDFNAVGAMGGILSGNIPVFVVENGTDGNRAYTSMHEGEGKVLRFGVYDRSVGDHLVWMRDVLGAGLSEALKLFPDGGLAINPILAQGVAMGDDFHVRITAASSLLFRELAPKLARVGMPQEQLEPVLDFLSGNVNFFLTLGMAAGKATLDAAAGVHAGSVVTCMTRNGREFAIRVSGLGDRWFTGPEEKLDTLYFPGFSDADACPDCGDSAIIEAYGFGGLVAVAAPAVQQLVGTGEGGFADALATSEEQSEIVVADNPNMPIPNWDFHGVPVGIDIRKVVSTGIAPLITTAVMHKQAGIGMVGIGKVRASMPCFTSALEALAEARGVEPTG
ncbi:DUF1116 domain-containing protein [Pseudonocardia bannensis]|uniref:DUF1116 domain-containing protein n=1 Tax=Pseudonocardia bannensis TaxID=630973 RepID=A0A848DQ26_9PSEU|nr:DUF1116 domain-containing protein [Pseudonocardia bannensis]NMH94645.1 DUF1116 domain-containing protein [Pseudonocardia bannensis]